MNRPAMRISSLVGRAVGRQTMATPCLRSVLRSRAAVAGRFQPVACFSHTPVQRESRPSGEHVIESMGDEKIDSIDVSELEPYPSEFSFNDPYERLVTCSLDAETGVIHVPASSSYSRLPEDKNITVVDKGTRDTARQIWTTKKDALDAVLRAVAAAQPSARFDDVDVLVSDSVLAFLGRIAAGLQRVSPINSLLSLRKVGNTLVIRKVNLPPKEGQRQLNPSNHIEGLEDEVWPRTEEHKNLVHRTAVKYQLGGVNVVVDHTFRGLVDENAPTAGPDAPAPPTSGAVDGVIVRDDTIPDDAISFLSARPRGRAPRKTSKLDTNASVNWFSRSPWVLTATTRRAEFHDLELQRSAEKLSDWEKERQTALGRLSSLLAKLRDTVPSDDSTHLLGIRCDDFRAYAEVRTWKPTSAAEYPHPLSDATIKKLWT